MRAADPRGLRRIAAELYADLARDGDEIAVVGFDGTARTSPFVALRSPDDRAALDQAIGALMGGGLWADLTVGLAEAARLLEAARGAPAEQERVLLLTDGRCDPDPLGPLAEAARAAGARRLEAFCRERALGELGAALGGARVIAVGLSPRAPGSLLQDLARRTGGSALFASEAAELPRLFAGVHAARIGAVLAEGPTAQEVPIAVEEGALSLDVVVLGPPRAGARLLDPKGAEAPASERRSEPQDAGGSADYRLLQVQRPASGPWTLSAARGGRYLAAQRLRFQLAFVGAPEVAEIGREVEVQVRLAAPGQGGEAAPLALLDRHELRLRASQAPSGCAAQLAAATPVVLRRGPDDVYRVRQAPTAPGELCFQAELAPGPGGVMRRQSAPLVVRAVPPFELRGSRLELGAIKQGTAGQGTLSLEGSAIGEAIEAELSLEGRPDLALDPAVIRLEPGGPRAFPLTIRASGDAAPGPGAVKLRVLPTRPKGYEGRAIVLDVDVRVDPLTPWERSSRWLLVGVGALALIVVVLGLALPPRFDRRTVVHARSARDADPPREVAVPLAREARAGFYRGARLLLGPGGAARTGGVVELRPAPGGGVTARPLGGRAVQELTAEAGGEPRRIALHNGALRCAPGVRYEIEGADLVIWIERRPR